MSSKRPSVAESVFFEYVRTVPETVAPDVGALCREYPHLAAEITALREAYMLGQSIVRSVGPGAAPDAGSSSGKRRYTVRGEIARGGMGIVLEVWDEELRRPLAMKILRESEPGSTDVLARIGTERRQSRLLNEAQILAQLDHPGIVPVIEAGRNAAGAPFFAMQLVRGFDLAQVSRLLQEGAEGWSLARAVGVVQRVCEAMAYAHEHGVVHRDLKPQNVMVGRYGEVYVMDWGLAKARGTPDSADIRLREVRVEPEGRDGSTSLGSVRTDRRDASDGDSFSPLRTFDGDVVGTPAYMSPEQAAGATDSVDELSDVYGVGAILYHLLSGVAPYAEHASQGPHAVLAAVRAGAPAPLARAAYRVPPDLAAVCSKAMERDRERRYASMDALTDDLRAWLEGRVVNAYRTGLFAHVVKWSGRQRLAAALLLLLFVVAGAAAVTLGVLYRQSEQRRRAAVVAQTDALRRQGARFPQAPGGRELPTLVDEFDDDRIDRRWIVEGRPSLVEESGGALRLTSSNDSSTVVRLDPFINTISGDFDLEVEFELIGFSVPKVERGERNTSIRITTLDGSTIVEIGRHAEFRSTVTPGIEQSCCAMRPGTLRRWYVEDTRSTGRLRITRRGTRISTYTWRDEWYELLSTDWADEEVGLALVCRDFYVDEPSVFLVKRLRFRNLGSGRRPHALTSFMEDFSGESLPPALRIRSNAGVIAVLDGRLYLEKLPERRGEVVVELDGQGEFVLSGDFDVSFRFELERYPIPESGQCNLSFRVLSRDLVHFGTIEVLAKDGKLRYQAYYHSGHTERPVDGKEGRLRILRQGNRLSFQTWNDGWEELLARPEVNGEPEMLFRIQLEATSDEDYVVAIDDLAATCSPETVASEETTAAR